MSDTKTDTEPKRPKQGRSPAYPGLNISDAIAKAKLLFEAEGKYPAPMPSAFKAWGFGEKSSSGRETRAALRYYGLITIEGDGDAGKVKLTDEAFRILLDEREDQTEKKAIIRRLAAAPSIHKKLIEKFPEGIKSDATAAHFLMIDEGFNKSAATELIEQFKETASFAGLFEPASMPDIPPAGSENRPPETGARQETGRPGGNTPPPPPPPAATQVKIMQDERIVFTEEGHPNQYLKLVASGELDDVLLEALEDFVKRQRKRLEKKPETAAN